MRACGMKMDNLVPLSVQSDVNAIREEIKIIPHSENRSGQISLDESMRKDSTRITGDYRAMAGVVQVSGQPQYLHFSPLPNSSPDRREEC